MPSRLGAHCSCTPRPRDRRQLRATAGRRYVVESSGSARGIVDTADGAVVQLPAGVALLRVDGPLAVLTVQTRDGVRYSRVPTSVLTAC